MQQISLLSEEMVIFKDSAPYNNLVQSKTL